MTIAGWCGKIAIRNLNAANHAAGKTPYIIISRSVFQVVVCWTHAKIVLTTEVVLNWTEMTPNVAGKRQGSRLGKVGNLREHGGPQGLRRIGIKGHTRGAIRHLK